MLMEWEVGVGEVYDPSRDIFNFMKPMLSQCLLAFRDRAFPALEQAMGGMPDADVRICRAFEEMTRSMQDVCESEDPEHYRVLVDLWLSRAADDEAVDLVLRVLGRAMLQFYVECASMRSLKKEQRWPNGMDEVIAHLIRTEPATPQLPWYRRIPRALRYAVKGRW